MAARSLRRALFLLVLGCSTSGRAPSDEVSVHVARLAIDPQTDSPVLVLTEDGGERTLALWIGFAEASSIAAEMQQIRPPRPNTHDLLQHVIADLGGRVERVVVTELHESTYYAVLRVEANGKRIEIDARPSDAIALALRVAAPLFVRESLFEKSRDEPTGSDGSQETRFVPGGSESRVGRSEAEKGVLRGESRAHLLFSFAQACAADRQLSVRGAGFPPARDLPMGTRITATSELR